ncbi:hypothetical protein CRG98_027937 [Punica granatum]|uniref:Uncharacterized protein n=1 Tax=Punica granatum TaxID=22663 RepID=A0A2I0J5W9_PUNGR|nr:hypothetical protein CRG98_027937 [Punica granatum]
MAKEGLVPTQRDEALFGVPLKWGWGWGRLPTVVATIAATTATIGVTGHTRDRSIMVVMTTIAATTTLIGVTNHRRGDR